jgi:Ca2+-binding RTX toxin-like protein
MPSYTLEIEAFGVFATNAPSLEVWEDGVLDSTHLISASGTSFILTINYPGTVPTSLSFTFNDGFAAAGRTIEIRSVKINDQYVNVGNYLSSDSLVKSASASVDIASSDFIFDSSDPALSEFTLGATRVLTGGNDTVRTFLSASPEIFDALSGRDVIYLGAGDDKVFGNAGNDVIHGGAGDDLISGGADNDRIYGGDGNDRLYGGTGNDRIHGGLGNDEIHGGDGDDRLNGHIGNDVITGGLGADKLTGADGDDYLFGGAGNDLLSGGNGVDTLDGGDGDDLIYAGLGDDVINGGDGIDIIIGEAGNDTLSGNDGNDTIYGGTGADTIYGGANDDTIGIGNGDFVAGEIIDGGTGTDELLLINATTVDFTTGTLANLETLTGSANDDDVTYTIQQALDFTTIDLGAGTDNSRIQISGTVDVTALGTPTVSNTENGFLTGSTGNDDLTISGAQLDALIFGAGTIDFNTGADILNLTSTSADLNTLGVTNASILGIETISAVTAGAGVSIFLAGQTESFTIIGSGFNDTLYSGMGDDIINAGNGDDFIESLGGIDTIDGGAGNDTISLNNGDFVAGESLTGGAGVSDTIELASAVTVDFTTGTIATIESLLGSTGDDNVTIGAAVLAGDFTTVDLAGGTDSLNTDVSGTVDISGSSLPTITNVETGDVTGSAGNDTFTVTGAQLDALLIGASTIDLGAGTDTLNITSTSADLNLLGATDGSILGLETISASSAGAGVEINMSAQTESLILTGSGFSDTLIGGSNNDTINGGDGNNILTGLDGNDTITGGIGNDTILGGNGDDILTGGAGDDTIYGATIIGQSGVETVIQTSSAQWHSVTFGATITNPIVKMSNMTNNDGDFYVIRVRDVTDSGFQYQIDEFDYLDGSRVLAEEVSWIAVAQGTHTLDNGLVVQAGTVTATNESFTTVNFNAAFGSAPVVMTQVMTDNDSGAVGTRNRSRTTSSFQIQMLEEEAADGVHATEDIGWIAIDNGGSVGTGFLVGETGNSVTHNVTTVVFPSAFANTPVVVHDQQTRDGGDTSYSQADGITTADARFFIGEEQSANAEVNHITEVVGYFALNEGLLTEAGGGDNTLSGGAGLDTLFGGDGLDTFIFEAASAFLDRDILADFSAGEGDILDISDLLTSFSGTITDHIFFDDSSGTDTIVQVDIDGVGGVGFQDIAFIQGITGLDEATLFTNGNIVV